MLPRDHLVFRVVDGEIVPGWLTSADDPWLRDLLDALAAADGARQRELLARLREAPRVDVPHPRLRMAVHVLSARVEHHPPDVPAREVRARVFGEGATARRAGALDRDALLARASGELGFEAAEALFADVPAERRVAVPRPLPTPAELRTEINLALAQGLVRRAHRLEIELDAGARDVVRAAHLRRLLCVATPRDDGGASLEISGVCALFRRTTLYGRALASLVPRLGWCGGFELRAWCDVDGEERLLRLGPTDGLRPVAAPRRHDSLLEERFAADLARVAPEWALHREPAALQAGGSLVFPDFALERDGRRWLVEIVGFWTREYLDRKLAALAGTGVLLCIDQQLGCGAEDVGDLPVVWFRKRLDPRSVLDALEGLPPVSAPARRRIGLGALFIDFAGRHPPEDPIHGRLEALRVGEVLEVADGLLCTPDGPVAALSAQGRRRLSSTARVRVAGLLPRERAQSGPAFRPQLKVERWTVPLLDLQEPW